MTPQKLNGMKPPDDSGGSNEARTSAEGGGSAAARCGNFGGDRRELRFGTALCGSAAKPGEMKRMTEGRRGGLSECRTQGAGRFRNAARVRS